MGDERLLVSEHLSMQDLPNERTHLCEAARANHTKLFMWQSANLVMMVLFIDECLKLLYTASCPEMAKIDLM